MRGVLLLSGGLDSAVALRFLLSKGHTLHCLTVRYGQKHDKETGYAWTLAREANVPIDIVSLEGLSSLFDNSSLVGRGIVPDGHYTDESMKTTVVPNRNMILVSVALARCISLGYDTVYYSAHQGDHTIYPDCREAFVSSLDQTAQLCHFDPKRVICPFIHLIKADIVSIGSELGVDFKKTWSCYKGGRNHCGKCGTCVERREAFTLSGVSDPTEYD